MRQRSGPPVRCRGEAGQPCGVTDMNKLLFAMTALGALAVAAPAAAQTGYATGYNDPYGYNARGDAGIDARLAQLEARLNADISAGAISRSDERRLRAQIAGLRRLEWQYG